MEGAAYFLFSEGLANVLKHSAASRAVVRLSSVGGRLVVEVADDGAGFMPAEVSGSGLTGLRDRFDAVGGTFRISSRPGEGTRLDRGLRHRCLKRYVAREVYPLLQGLDTL